MSHTHDIEVNKVEKKTAPAAPDEEKIESDAESYGNENAFGGES